MSLPGNYCPISMTSVVSKLKETTMRDKIANQKEDYHIINDSQHGFRRNRSCLTKLLM